MNLDVLLHHDVLVEFVDGGGMKGYVDAHISAEDNSPDPESIVVFCRNAHYEIGIEEIKKVTILDN